ncbi:hypothetical protein KPL40_19705, partial [Clostridium gasigenes]|uniref:RHS repeat domain-containing protein n=1 Tax=Clostridium gasigenes TaxID=94869 RepID=UPI001D86F6C9
KDSTGITSYNYDANYQIIDITKGGVKQLAYTYDELGNKKSITDSKKFSTSYTYDKINRLNTINFSGKLITYNYDNNGNNKSIVYPGGNVENIVYDKDNRISNIDNVIGSGKSISKSEYSYYDNSLLKSKKDNSGTTNYEYNKNGVITKVTSPENIVQYNYDLVNNRITESEINISNHPSGYIAKDGKETQYRSEESKYLYDNNNKLISVTENMKDDKNNNILQKTINYYYDNNGNQLKENSLYTDKSLNATSVISNNTYTINQFDGFNRMKKVDITKNNSISTSEFSYNGDDLRVKKAYKDSSVNNTTNYLFDGQDLMLESNDKGEVQNRYIKGNKYVSKIDSTNKISYYMYNGHGDVVQTIDEVGNVENKYKYDSFGNLTVSEEKSYNPIRYSGEYYDNNIGLHYLKARYYNSKIGRFISEDSYEGEDSNPLSLNRYTYCNNEPLLNIDPTGHNTCPIPMPQGGFDWEALKPIMEGLAGGASVLLAPEVLLIGGTAALVGYLASDNYVPSHGSTMDFNFDLHSSSKPIIGNMNIPKVNFSDWNFSMPNINIPKMDFSSL